MVPTVPSAVGCARVAGGRDVSMRATAHGSRPADGPPAILEPERSRCSYVKAGCLSSW
jgi:hypothetical protein